MTNGKLEVVMNEPKYWEFIREVRNHPETKQGFVQQEYIDQATHRRYMEQYGEHYIICLHDGEPAGFAGCVEGDIRVATHSAYLRRGIAQNLIKTIRAMYPESCAKVKLDNTASLKLFEACGFVQKYYLLEQISSADEK